MKRRTKALFSVFLSLVALISLSAQSVKPESARPESAAMAAARAQLAAAKGSAELALSLARLEKTLAPAELLSLVQGSLASLDAVDRGPIALRAAGLSLLLGRFADAAARYEEASALALGGRDSSLLLRAARCRVAAGELDRAAELTALILIAGEPQGGELRLSRGARLVGAWVLAAQGRTTEAIAIAQGLAAEKGPPSPTPELRLESLFLVWACTGRVSLAKNVARDSESAVRDAAASGLQTIGMAAGKAILADFPGSPEALIVSGAASFAPLPHWYVGALGSPFLGTLSPGQSGSKGGDEGIEVPTPAPVASSGKRLQVGYFSKEENAKSLRSELGAKGFVAAIEARTRTGGTEARWIVVVDGGANSDATREGLKDAGYESYPLD